MHCPQRKASLHLPAHISLSPVNVCGTATVWPFAVLRLIPLLMHLLCLHWLPLATHQLLFVFVAIGLLSTSIHLCLRGHDVNPKWLIKGKSTPKKQHLCPLFAYITHNTSWVSCEYRMGNELRDQQFLLKHMISNCSYTVYKAQGDIFSYCISYSIKVPFPPFLAHNKLLVLMTWEKQ